MNWKLIFTLSLFGLAMAGATITLIPSKIEPLFWLVIFTLCAVLIAKKAPGKFFLHGFSVSLVNCVWITCAHMLFYFAYIAHHPEEAAMGAKMPLPNHPRLMMLLTGPIFGAAFGLALGLFAWTASKVFKKQTPLAA